MKKKRTNDELKAIAPEGLGGQTGAEAGKTTNAGASCLYLDSITTAQAPCYFCNGTPEGIYKHPSGVTLPICGECCTLYDFEMVQTGGIDGNN